jgi:hypothetical protein
MEFPVYAMEMLLSQPAIDWSTALAHHYGVPPTVVGMRCSSMRCMRSPPMRPSENEAATSGNVALLIYKTMTSSTIPTWTTEAKISVPQLI